MKIVASRLGHDIYDSPQHLPELRLIVVRLNLEFLDVIQRGLHRVRVANRTVVVDAVEQVHIAAVVLTVNRWQNNGAGRVPKETTAEAGVFRSVYGTNARP